MGGGITGQISNKPGIKKGGHTVLVSEVHLIRPHAYSHRQKFHAKPPGWNIQGTIEAKEIM